MSLPVTLPIFANEEITDPISGQLNTAEPTGSYETEGLSFTEIPTRQHTNFLFRWVFRWLKYFKDTFVNLESGTVAASLYCGTGFNALGSGSEGELSGGFINFNLPWLLINNHLFLKMPNIFGTNTGSSSLIIRILDVDLEHFKWKKNWYAPAITWKNGIFTDIFTGQAINDLYIYTFNQTYSTGNNGIASQVIMIPIYDS
jgi:hypothetical protein